MGQRKIKKLLIEVSKDVNIPDVRSNILEQLDMLDSKKNFETIFEKKKPRALQLSFVSCFVAAIIFLSLAISFSFPKNPGDKELRGMDRVQSVYAYQVALLTTLVNHPESVDLNSIEVNDALSNSIGFVDFILNKDKTTSTLYQCFNSNYDYYLSTRLGEKELCKFYYKEHFVSQSKESKTTVLQGYIEIGNENFDVYGQSYLDSQGEYILDLMLGYQDTKVCISSNEFQTDSYEYRVYNEDALCKKVSLEFKDNQIYMNVNFQNEYFKFQIHGNNNQYTGNYHTETSSGSLMVVIENDKYNFNVDNNKSSAERYILP